MQLIFINIDLMQVVATMAVGVAVVLEMFYVVAVAVVQVMEMGIVMALVLLQMMKVMKKYYLQIVNLNVPC